MTTDEVSESVALLKVPCIWLVYVLWHILWHAFTYWLYYLMHSLLSQSHGVAE